VLVTAAGGQVLAGCLDGAVGSYQPDRLEQLWAAVPRELRVEVFDAGSVPARYRGAFTFQAGRCTRLSIAGLPTVMQRELTWCMHTIAERGMVVWTPGMVMLVARLREVATDLGEAAAGSLVAMSPQQWQQQMAMAVHRRTGRLPGTGSTKTVREQLLRCYRLLWAGYDTRPWWQREIWDPTVDHRIPIRAHEPLGRKAVHFDRILTGWLRDGLQWCSRVCLDTGALTWSTVHVRVSALVVFDAFLTGRSIDRPDLADEPAQLRVLMLDYLSHVRGLQVQRIGPTLGQPISPSRAKTLLTSLEQFYAFMHDHRDEAAAALAEPGWARLGPQHYGLFRRGEKPRLPRRTHEHDVIDDEAFSKIMAGAGVLGAPTDEQGLGDEQATRILMLLARTGRRMNEILLLDRDPLLPLDTPAPEKPDGFVAKLHYQQTKIVEGPDTIPVDQEIVAIVRAQQEWSDRFLAGRAAPGRQGKYLFLAARKNRNGDRPYGMTQLHTTLSELVGRLDVRDSTGRLVDFQRTHRFRHTKATSLLNAGVPLHVVQRYLGHLSPTMTMTYAQTLAATHEREFLRYRKLTADARELDIDPRDLYDMLQLSRHTDRILPNGCCLLPPRQVCGKGNACLTCDKFATDATFLPELTTQAARTGQLIDERCAAFTARTGQAMSADNVWLAGRRAEQDALAHIIATLEQAQLLDGAAAVRGAGVAARTDALTTDPVHT
jgi:integrase